MALPMNKTPVYNMTIPSTGKSVKFRPFLVKDEKALLLAQQSEDPIVMINTLKEVIRDCLDKAVDVDALATFDIEYIFAQLRAKSVGENVELIVKCAHCEDENAKMKVSIDLTKLNVEKPEGHTDTIQLFGDVGIKLKYPDIDLIRKMETIKTDDMNQVFEIVVSCIDFIYDSEQMYYAKEQSKAEMMQFLENLTSEQFTKVQAFFETMPKIRQKIEFDCPVCGKHNETVLEGINNFF